MKAKTRVAAMEERVLQSPEMVVTKEMVEATVKTIAAGNGETGETVALAEEIIEVTELKETAQGQQRNSSKGKRLTTDTAPSRALRTSEKALSGSSIFLNTKNTSRATNGAAVASTVASTPFPPVFSVIFKDMKLL